MLLLICLVDKAFRQKAATEVLVENVFRRFISTTNFKRITNISHKIGAPDHFMALQAAGFLKTLNLK